MFRYFFEIDGLYQEDFRRKVCKIIGFFDFVKDTSYDHTSFGHISPQGYYYYGLSDDKHYQYNRLLRMQSKAKKQYESNIPPSNQSIDTINA